MDRRNHLQSTIMTHDLEMSYVTDRQGSPQTLVCTKNRRNHVRRLAQYRSDLATMATLKNLFVTAVNQENKIVTLLTRLKKTAQDAV